MAESTLDELISWSLNRRSRVIGFTGVRGEYRLNLLSRLLVPGFGPDFAAKGDVLHVIELPTLLGDVSIPLNLSRRRSLSADPFRVILVAALLFLFPLPSIFLAGRWWLWIVSGLLAAAFLHRLFASGATSPSVVTKEGADMNLSVWRIEKARITGQPFGFEISEEPEPEWVAALDRAYAGALEAHEAVEIGQLPIPDGKLLACEPFQIHDPRPYTIAVPQGTYPVFISIAASPKTPDQRIAFAWVRLREGVPARWELARTRSGEEVSVGVDSGIAGFTSASAAKTLIDTYRKPGLDYSEPLSDAILKAMDKTWRDTRGWAMLAHGEATLAAFSSGFGDGTYPVYRAVDSRGRRLAVAIGFLVAW